MKEFKNVAFLEQNRPTLPEHNLLGADHRTMFLVASKLSLSLFTFWRKNKTTHFPLKDYLIRFYLLPS